MAGVENKNPLGWAGRQHQRKSRWEGLSMHERFGCGGTSLVGLDQFPLLSKVRAEKVGAYSYLTKGSADLAEDYMTLTSRSAY